MKSIFAVRPDYLPCTFAIILAMNVVGAMSLCGAEPQTLSKDDCVKLIQELTSRNLPPRILDRRDERPPEYSSDFDFEELKRVKRAYDQLDENIEIAIPLLMDHVADKRYAVTRQDENDFWANWSVGMLCSALIRNYLAVYRPLVRLPTCTAEGHFPGSPEALQAWWMQNKDVPYWKIQLHYLEWALEREREVPFRSVEQEKSVIGSLQFNIDKLKRTKSPLKFKRELILRPK